MIFNCFRNVCTTSVLTDICETSNSYSFRSGCSSVKTLLLTALRLIQGPYVQSVICYLWVNFISCCMWYFSQGIKIVSYKKFVLPILWEYKDVHIKTSCRRCAARSQLCRAPCFVRQPVCDKVTDDSCHSEQRFSGRSCCYVFFSEPRWFFRFFCYKCVLLFAGL
jgi:hypothetical protein